MARHWLNGPARPLHFLHYVFKTHTCILKGVRELGTVAHKDLLPEPPAPQHANYLADVHDLTTTQLGL